MNSRLPTLCTTIGAQATRRTARGGLALVALLGLGGCTPDLDWREVTVPDTPLRAEMPCRPGRFERAVVVAGTPIKLFMLSCEAAGVTYGVASADVVDPARVESVLAGLAAAAQAALQAPSGTLEPFDLPGATPFRSNAGARFLGKRPDGAAVEESLRVFARGTRVYQASAIGATLPAAAVGPFEAGLRFDVESPAAGPR
jgi:hypothetical protein